MQLYKGRVYKLTLSSQDAARRLLHLLFLVPNLHLLLKTLSVYLNGHPDCFKDLASNIVKHFSFYPLLLLKHATIRDRTKCREGSLPSGQLILAPEILKSLEPLSEEVIIEIDLTDDHNVLNECVEVCKRAEVHIFDSIQD